MKISRRDTCLLVMSSLLLLPGCGASADGERPMPDDSAESVGISQEALYESTCWTSTTPDATVVTGTPPGCGGGGIIPLTHFISTSPNASYNHATCPSQYVVEVTNILNKGFALYVGNPGFGTTAADWCPGYWARAEAKGWKNNQWTSLGSTYLVGQWVPADEFPGYCRVTGTPIPALPKTHGYSKVRLSAQGGFATVLTQVTAGVAVGVNACP